MKLPLTIMSYITKLGCLIVVIGIPVAIIVLIIYLTLTVPRLTSEVQDRDVPGE